MSLTRRKTAIMFAAMAAIVVIVVGVGTIMAQRGSTLKDALAPKEGDATVVATVNGLDVTEGDVRRSVEFWMMIDQSLTREAAVDASIVTVIDDFITEAEVERRGITSTTEEVRTYMTQFKDACQGVDGAECRAQLESFGFDPSSDAYWEDTALPQYGRALNEIKLFQAFISEQDKSDASNEDLIALRESMVTGLRNSASITWKDDDVKRAYERALSQE